MQPMFFPFRLTIAFFLLLIPLTGAFPADPLTRATAPPVSVTPEVLKAKIKEVEAAAEMDEATKAKLTELYRKALSQLETARAHSAAADGYVQARENAPKQAKTLQQKLEQAAQTSPIATLKVSEKTPLAELESLLLTEKANLAAVEAKLDDLEKQLAVQAGRPQAARERLTAAKQRQEALASELKLPVPTDERPTLTEAKRWVLETEGLMLSAEIRMLDQELLSQPMRLELLKAERDQAAYSVKWIDARVKFLEEQISQRRRAEAEQAQEETEAARREAIGKHPLVQAVAERNAALSTELGTLAANLERVLAEEDTAKQTADRLEKELSRARQKLEIAGLSQALGQVLLKQRRDLPDVRVFYKQARVRAQQIAESGLQQMRHHEERQALSDIDAAVERLTAGLPPKAAADIHDELRTLLKNQRALLDKVIATDDAYLQALGELDFAHRHLIEVTEAYDAFLAERLLWIRSTPPLTLANLLTLPEEMASLLSPSAWLEILDLLYHQLTHAPVLGPVLVLFVVLVWNGRRLHRALAATGTKVGRPTTDRFAFTMEALGLTLLLAVPWPLLVATVGWQLQLPLEATDFTKAIGQALALVSAQFYFLWAFRELCHTHGLAARHFHWSEPTLQRLRRAVDGLMVTFLPAGGVTVAAVRLDSITLGGALGKLALVVALLVLAIFSYRVLHPTRGVVRDFLREHPASLLTRLRYLWFALVVATPLVLAGLALSGYMYTAGTLTRRLIDTQWFVLGLLIIHQLGVRWLLLARRRLAYQALLERREAARAAAEAQGSQPSEESSPIEVEEPKVDLAALSQESRKLLNTAVLFAALIGLWLIWSAVLPAFRVLEDVSLWYQTTLIAGEEKRVPVTLASLVLALLITIITIVTAKSLPALLEITLLQRLALTSGSRYAVTTLSGYAIAAIGIVLFFSTLGVSWSKIQWLVAALSVGIGFGLQEIVANFISGLIILFERPVRVGDIVTVGDTDGVVTRIRIRATTIRNWDRKELLVPNKEFITSRVLNWSLSDQMTRVVIIVGVAYGSDVDKALALMAETAAEHEHVLEDPKPMLTFEGFGDNALTLILRCYLGSLDYRLATISELHAAINRKFNAAGIVIAFPQRDVHLDTTRPLDIRLWRDDGHPGNT